MMAQDTVNDLERERNDIQNIIAAKEKNVHMLSAKLDDEQSLVAKAQKNIKELQSRVEGGEEELEAERQARSKAERQRSDLAREIEQLGDRYDEASGATVAQVELNKKREAEIVKLRKDVEEANIASESVLTNLKRKQGDSVLEMQEQTDALQKMKAKIDKDKQVIMAEIADARAATEEVVRSQASADKSNKALVETLNAINKKLDAAQLTIGDFAMMKNKIANENGELLRIVGDLENNLNMLAKAKSALGAQPNDVKALCDNEARDRQLLLGKYRNLEHEVDVAREALEEEASGRENVLRLNAKAEGDAAAMRQKYEQEAVAKAEELEMTKMKLAARNTEAEAAIDNLNAKLAQIEKAKSKIQIEINEMSTNLDQAQVVNAAMERKAKQFDKTITEMKGKVDRLSFWLTSRSKERRSTFPFISVMVLSNCLAFLSIAALTTWAWSRLVDISLTSIWILLLAFSIWASLACRLSMAASASVFLAASFILVISSSSALATASCSYFCLMAAASPSALAFSLRTFSRPATSSSRASLAPSSSCSRFLYLPSRSCLSLASLSQRAFTSLSWAARADLALASMLRLFSRSPTILSSSPFSLAILFLDIPKSPRVRLAASTFLLAALSASSRDLLDLSAEDWLLTTSSVAALASPISAIMICLSFSILAFILHRASICSCISSTESPCFLFRLPRTEALAMLDSSTSLRSFTISASRFLFSSTWATVAPLASSYLSPSCSISLARSDLCLSALARAWRSASSSSSADSTRACSSLMFFWALAT